MNRDVAEDYLKGRLDEFLNSIDVTSYKVTKNTLEKAFVLWLEGYDHLNLLKSP